jgi:F-type H+-transporting ATPase subunit a
LLLFSIILLISLLEDNGGENEYEFGTKFVDNLQVAIFIANICGILPGLETITSETSLAFMCSFSAIILVTLIGFSLHSLRFMSCIYPVGTPIVIVPFIICIELISYFAKAISLGMRLFANMFAGHSLVKIILAFIWQFLAINAIYAIPAIILICLILVMEIGIAYLQSYVFGALFAMYLDDAITLSH